MPNMKKITQKTISKKVGCSEGFLSQILSGIRRPSWTMAKKLGMATGTDPIWWMDADLGKIREAIERENR